MLLDLAIDADSWASIVSSVSNGGEINYRFYAARKFHQSDGMVDVVRGVPTTTPTPTPTPLPQPG